MRGTIEIDPPSSFQLPSLKIITLNPRLRLKYGVCELFKLLSGCPVLEDLSFDVGEFKSKIWVPILKRFSIYSGNPNYKLEINGDINNDNAHDKEWEDRWYGEWYADRALKLLAALHNVKFLKIYPYVSNVREVPFS